MINVNVTRKTLWFNFLFSPILFVAIVTQSGCLTPNNEYTIESLVAITNQELAYLPLEPGILYAKVLLNENQCFTYVYVYDESIVERNLKTGSTPEMFWIVMKNLIEQGFPDIQNYLNVELNQDPAFKWLAKEGYCVSYKWQRENSDTVASIEFEFNGQRWISLD